MPVGTLAIGEAGAKNAGLFAAQMLATRDPELQSKLQAYRKELGDAALGAKLE